VAFQNTVGVGGHRLAHEPLIERVIDDHNLSSGTANTRESFALGRMRNGQDAVRAVERPPRKKPIVRPVSAMRRRAAGREHVGQIVHSNDQPRNTMAGA